MKHRVLIVDDEELVRETIKLQLKDTGYEFIEAKNGEKAIQFLRDDDTGNVDAIICDVRMPKINGVEAVAYFRRKHPSIPVIVLTGFPDVKLAVDFIAKGVFDYLVKPVDKDKLIKTVTKAVIQHSIITG